MGATLVINSLNYDILDNIRFSLEKGTINAVVGNNDSESHLLLECIAGLHDYSGDVLLNGDIVIKRSKMDRNISIYNGIHNLTSSKSFDNILEPLLNMGFDTTSARKKVYRITKQLDIENLMHREVATLSYSEKKMISIAKSLVIESKIILLDNVFESLDIYYREKLMKYLKTLNGSVILFTSENSEDLLFANNILVLKDGKLIENDTKENVFKK